MTLPRWACRFSANTDIEYVTGPPFTKTIKWFDPTLCIHPTDLARISNECHVHMLSRAGIQTVPGCNEPRQSMACNPLTTQIWMLLMPHLCQQVGAKSFNTLGFAGSFFLRNRDELVPRIGPTNVLCEVSVAKP
ncbi:MAG: ATP adenylyltransferase family protein [Acidiferrobacterales bacterium]